MFRNLSYTLEGEKLHLEREILKFQDHLNITEIHEINSEQICYKIPQNKKKTKSYLINNNKNIVIDLKVFNSFSSHITLCRKSD